MSRNTKEAVKDSMAVIIYFLLTIVSLGFFCSCSIKRHVIEQERVFDKTHVVRDSVFHKEVLRNDIISAAKDYFAKREMQGDVFFYDTSLAVDTGGGFYSPVLAHVVFGYNEEETSNEETSEVVSENIVVSDSISSALDELVEEERHSEKDTRGKSFNYIGISLLVMIIIFCVCYKKRR